MVQQVNESTIEKFTHEKDGYVLFDEQFVVDSALIVYKSNKSEYYMEKANFVNDNNETRFVGSSPLKAKDIVKLREAVNTIKIKKAKSEKKKFLEFEGFIPDNVLYWSRNNPDGIIWTSDPKTVTVHMGYSGYTYVLPVPKIVFATDGEAVKGFLMPKRKSLNSYLDALPLPNFYSSSVMCNGNTQLPEYETMNEYIKAWEDRIFKTNWSHENMGVGGIEGLKKLNGKKRLPKEFRKETSTTIKKLIEWVNL